MKTRLLYITYLYIYFGVSKGFSQGPVFFLVLINRLPKILFYKWSNVFFADGYICYRLCPKSRQSTNCLGNLRSSGRHFVQVRNKRSLRTLTGPMSGRSRNACFFQAVRLFAAWKNSGYSNPRWYTYIYCRLYYFSHYYYYYSLSNFLIYYPTNIYFHYVSRF